MALYSYLKFPGVKKLIPINSYSFPRQNFGLGWSEAKESKEVTCTKRRRDDSTPIYRAALSGQILGEVVISVQDEERKFKLRLKFATVNSFSSSTNVDTFTMEYQTMTVEQ